MQLIRKSANAFELHWIEQFMNGGNWEMECERVELELEV